MEAEKGPGGAHTDDAERRVAALLAQVRAEVRAPDGLRTRIEASRPSPRARRTRRVGYGGALAGALAAVVLALILVLPGGAPGAPSLSQAAAVWARGPQAAAPVPDRDNPGGALNRRIDDVYFPNWTSLHWRAIGQRVDHLNGRLALTVYYSWRGHRIAYTIVAAPALKQPAAMLSRLHGTELRTLTLGGRLVVTWRRAGHTCVLSGAGMDASVLRGLAAWKAPGTARG
jgi:hypothetical protein